MAATKSDCLNGGWSESQIAKSRGAAGCCRAGERLERLAGTGARADSGSGRAQYHRAEYRHAFHDAGLPIAGRVGVPQGALAKTNSGGGWFAADAGEGAAASGDLRAPR